MTQHQHPFTVKQMQVLHLVCAGFEDSEIDAILGEINGYSAKVVLDAKVKLGAANRGRLVALLLVKRWINRTDIALSLSAPETQQGTDEHLSMYTGDVVRVGGELHHVTPLYDSRDVMVEV